MDIDFHFGTIYILSRWADFSSDTAKTLATTSQFVDDNLPNNPLTRKYRHSGHAPLDNLIDLVNDDKVWIPFHFLPSLDGSGDERLICQKNSSLAQELASFMTSITNLDNLNLFRLGISLHVYADTWAHRKFSGFITSTNRVNNPNIILPIQADWEKAEDEFIHNLPPLGHVKAIHWPDRPYAYWQCSAFPDGRKNWEEFLEAAQSIYNILAKINNCEDLNLSQNQENLLLDSFQNITDENYTNRNNEWINRITTGFFEFTDTFDSTAPLNYNPSLIISDPDFLPEFYAALEDHYNWVKEKLMAVGINRL